MRIGLDVAQTCVERAGCAWSAASTAQALATFQPAHEYVLYHHFGEWVNDHTNGGFSFAGPHVSAPMLRLSRREASDAWTAIARGESPLPGNPEIVHSFSFQAPKLRGSRLIFTVHDVAFWTHHEFATEGNRLVCQRGLLNALQNADGLHFPTEHTRREFDRLLGGWLTRTKTPWAVVPWASRFETLSAPTSVPRKHWLFVGSLEPRKNLSLVLDALTIYRATGGTTPLFMAGGSGWKSETIKAQIGKLEAEGAIRRLGYVTDTELLEHYRSAKGFIFPSWCEGFGLPVLEALSQGAPVLAANTSCLPEVGGDAALYFPPDDPVALAEHMRKLDSSEDLLHAQSIRALARASEFSWSQTASKLVSFYHEVLAQP